MKFFKTVFGGIAKAIGYVMVTLGLWLPSLFTVAFFIICAVTKTDLSKGIMAVFYCGLGFTAVGGLAIAMWRHKRLKQRAAKEKKNKRSAVVRPEPQPSYDKRSERTSTPYRRTDERENSYGSPVSYGRTDEREDGYGGGYSYGRTVEREQPSYSRAAAPRDYSDLDRKYFGGEAPRRSDGEYRSYEGDSALDADALWRRLSGADVPDEQPLMFRTRTDPDVYIYEYSDRYQYWRRTKAGMMLERTEFKKPEEVRGYDKVHKN